MVNDNSFVLAVGILLASTLTLMASECVSSASSAETPTASVLTYTPPNGVNCAEKKQGARPACWKSHDWDAYCRETGNCRNNRR